MPFLIAFLCGIFTMAVLGYFILRQQIKKNNTEWAKIVSDRFDKIPQSYHDAFDQGWEACMASDSAFRIAYEKRFGYQLD